MIYFPMRATNPSAQAKKQALQDHILALVQGRQLAGVAVAMGVGKTLIGLRDMERMLAGGRLPEAATNPFLVAAPTTAILDSWPIRSPQVWTGAFARLHHVYDLPFPEQNA